MLPRGDIWARAAAAIAAGAGAEAVELRDHDGLLGAVGTAGADVAVTRVGVEPAMAATIHGSSVEGPRLEALVSAICRVAVEAALATARDAERDDFLAHLQHSLRTPITALLGLGELAQMFWDEWSSGQQRQAVDDSVIAAEHLLRVTDWLDDPTVLAWGRWEPEPRSTSLAAIVDDALREVEHRRGDVSGTDVEATATEVVCDHDRVVQALSALIDNAFAHGVPGGHVGVKAEAHEDMALIVVANDGVISTGVAIEDLFAPYRRGTPLPGTRYNGVGLGLTVARRIARAHGGDVVLEPGEGVTTAHITFSTDRTRGSGSR